MGSQSRLDWVDALRGSAALAVAVLHFLETQYGGTDAFRAFGDVFNLGKFGVVLFFCVSGFVIPRSIKSDSRNPLFQFWISRFFRLYPAFWLSIVAALLLLDGNNSVGKVLANVTMMPKLFGMGDLVGVYWTLQIELVFYILISALFYAGRLNPEFCTRAGFFCLLVAGVASVFRYYTKVALPVAIPLALTLMLFSAASSGHERRDYKALCLTYGSFLAAMLPISNLAYSFDAGHGENWLSYFVSYSVAVAAFLFVRFRIQILVYLGKISYSVYLMHATVGLGFLEFAGPFLDGAFLFAAYLALTLGVSSLCYLFVEQPSIAIARRINARNVRPSDSVRVL